MINKLLNNYITIMPDIYFRYYLAALFNDINLREVSKKSSLNLFIKNKLNFRRIFY